MQCIAGKAGISSAWRELAVYCAIGCAGAVLDFSVYSGLVRFAGAGCQTANLAGGTLGMLNNFFMNYFFNFKARGCILARLACFCTIGASGLALSALCLWILVDGLGTNKYIAKVFALAFVTAVQFTLNRSLSFRESHATCEKPESGVGVVQ